MKPLVTQTHKHPLTHDLLRVWLVWVSAYVRTYVSEARGATDSPKIGSNGQQKVHTIYDLPQLQQLHSKLSATAAAAAVEFQLNLEQILWQFISIRRELPA